MTRPPVWLLDIDGVLNVASRKPPTFVWPADQWVQTRVQIGRGSLSLLAARPVVDFIRTVHEQGRAEVRWHTTWQHDAKAVADPLDLPDFEVQDAPEWPDASADTVWWKLPPAQRVAREACGLIWTDDDAYGHDLSADDLAALRASVPLLLIVPQSQLGLTPKHLRQIDQFLDECSGKAAA